MHYTSNIDKLVPCVRCELRIVHVAQHFPVYLVADVSYSLFSKCPVKRYFWLIKKEINRKGTPNSSFLDNVIVYPLGSCVVLKVVQEKGLKHAMWKSLGYFENLTGNKAIFS